MRVLHLSAYGGPYPGSFVPMIRAAARAVEQRGWRFEAGFTPEADDRPWYRELQRDGFAAWTAEARPRRAAGRALAARLAEPGPLLLHSHFSRWDVPAVLAAGRRPQTAIVWHVHTPLHEQPLMRARNAALLHGPGRAVDRLLSVGPEIDEQLRRRRALRSRVTLLPNGIDTAAFAPPSAAERQAARAALGVPGEQPLALFLGWDWERKGGRLLLEAVAELRGRGRPLVAAVVGAADEARRTAAELGVAEALTVVEPTDRIRDLYAAADLLAAPSAAEGMPFAVLEALSCGLPVVASDIPSHRVTADGLPACLIVDRRPAALAGGLEEVLAWSPQQRAERTARTREGVVARRSLDAWSAALLDVYDELAPDGQPRRRRA
ncbi:glycosyltransferase family 4 protein [Patulibacter defluvii]|uniref:glycosyltransferase family 4 protein n=1 Tax=Patulibacter defluvii TaxID=3095358 RepID=UPI002A7562B8|nr:glycosyltransferase family 4 protein [Patulibacter sp. DM4]